MIVLHDLRPLQALAASLFFKHRRLMLILPRQEGKTELGVRLLENCINMREPTQGLFLAKDTRSGRRATREKFLRIFDPKVHSVNTDRIYKRRDPRAVINIASVDKDPDRMRGGTYNLIHWSEVAFSKLDHGETVTGIFDKIINPTLKERDGYAFLESTTNGKNGFFDLWQNARQYGFHTFRVSYSQMLELGLVSQDEYDRVKATTHPLVFAQEYECEFVSFQGRAYDEFDQAIHVREVEPPEEWQKVIMAIDWGYDPSATCVLFGYVRDGIMCIFDEIHEKKQLLDGTFAQINARIERWSIRHFAAVADHEEDRNEELTRRGIPCTKAYKANVLGNRIEVKERLWRREIVIDPRCKFLIRDLETATWHPKKEGELDYSQFTYNHGDAEAAMRYLVRALGKFETEEPDDNPHRMLDQGSARAWEMQRGGQD